MKIYDITRELLSAEVYPGDPTPIMLHKLQISEGDACNLSTISMCLHNGTHIDAPLHFIDGGKSAEKLDLGVFIGECKVVTFFEPEITGADIDEIPNSCERLLIKGFGKSRLSKSAALALIDRGIRLVGIDHPTIGIDSDNIEVHKILLGADIAILEGLDFSGVPSGDYVLVAPPLKIKGADGVPTRAFLMKN
jgi:arylformamidase